MIRKTAATALISLAALGAHGAAVAQHLPQDAINLSNAKLSLPEAVAVAEQHHPGSKSTQAELEFKKGQLYYEVEVVTPQNEVFDVKVDAKDGKVLQSKPDNND
ncbi:MAG: PepSY domain-containing protein [Lautropia sp.]|nr:PepSY domain-containing protein [Lautropia sp.]